MDSILGLIERFKQASTPSTLKDIEAILDSCNIVEVLKQFPSSSQQNNESNNDHALNTSITLTRQEREQFQELQNRVKKVLHNDELKVVELNAKIRRKVKRFHEILSEVLEKNPQASSPTTGTEMNETITYSIDSTGDVLIQDGEDLTLDKDLVKLIEKVQSSTTALQLEENMTQIKPGIGNTFSRRKLKRAIEQLVKKAEIDSSMNARIRRRVTRVIKILSPQDSSGAASNASENDKTVGEKQNKKRKAAEISLNVPHIAFVGQLPYTCTEEDLRSFFQQNNITNEVKIRMLTDAKTNQSKGTAFVEFATVEDLNTALLLHHSTLLSRKINIEKSCGGKDLQKRKDMIEQQRVKQQKTIEFTFQQVFDDFAAKGILNPSSLGKEFKQKLMSYSPLILSKALAKYSELTTKERTLSKLDQIFTAQLGISSA